MESILQEIVRDVCKKYIPDNKIDNIIKKINKKYMSKKELNKDISKLISEDINNNELSITNTTNNYDIVIYTDGATSGNGKSNANAGFGIYVEKFTDNKSYKINRKFHNVVFNYNTTNYTNKEPDKSLRYNATNIRAEGYAILYSLHIVKNKLIDNHNIIPDLNNKLYDTTNLYPYDDYNFTYLSGIEINNEIKYSVIINTDSEFWIKVITKWMDNWVKKKIVFEKKNIDLLIYIYYISNILKKNNIDVIYNHVKGHAKNTKKNKKDFTEQEMGIFIADKCAVEAKTNSNLNFNLLN